MKTRYALVLTTTILACGAGEAQMPAPPAPDMTAADPLDQFAAPAEGTGFQIKLSPFKVPAGQEVYWCHRVPMPFDGSMDLSRIQAKFGKGSHHILIFAANERYDAGDGACSTGSFAFGTSMQEVARKGLRFLTGSQTPYAVAPESDTNFGDSGVGLRVAGGGTLFFQQHFVNTGATEIDARAVINFTAAKRPLEKRLESFFFFNPFIDIPAHAQADVKARCHFPADTEVAGLVSHMHQHGTSFEVQRVENDQLTDMLYKSDSWQEPVPRNWAPDAMLQMKAGDTLEYRCHYQNDTDAGITVGESATDEMCLLLGFHVSDAGTLWGLPGLGQRTPFGGVNPCELIH